MDEEARYHLKGFVEGGSYYLLSRQGHEVATENGETYGHEAETLYLDPAGELIILQDENGDVISTANLTGDAWPAGKTGTEPASMERVLPGEPDEADNWDTALLSGAGFPGTPGLPDPRGGRSVRKERVTPVSVKRRNAGGSVIVTGKSFPVSWRSPTR